MSRHGIVIKTAGDKALISTAREGVCAACAEQAGCTVGSGWARGPDEEIWAANPLAAVPGDLVEFELPEHGELKLSLLIWGLPLAGLLAGALLGGRLLVRFSLSPDLAAALGAGAGLVLAFVPLIISDRLAGRHHRFLPRITRIRPGRCEPAAPPQDP